MLDDRDHAVEASQGLNEPGAVEPTVTHQAPQESGPTPPEDGVVAVPDAPGPSAGARLVIALFVLSLIGFSIALGFQSLFIARAMPAFFTSNSLGVEGRTRLLNWLGAGAVAPLLGAGIYVAWQRQRAVEQLTRLARLLCPLLITGLVPGLYVWELGQRATLQYLFFLVFMVFVTERLWRFSLPEWASVRLPAALSRAGARLLDIGQRHGRWLAPSVVVLAALGYGTYTSYYTIHRHRLIQTFAFDLGIYDNLMYGALHGKFFKSPVLFGPGNYNYLAGHAEYGMLLFLPFYALRPGAETLLIIQSMTLGLAALPLFLFARTRLPLALSVVVSVGYLLFAPLHGPNFYDFHWLPLAIFFHFWLYFALATRRTWLAVAMVLCLFSMREDIALGLCVLGLFLWLTGERRRFGLLLSIASVSWFVLNKFVLMRLAGKWWFENMYAELFADGKSGYGSVLKTLLSNPTYSLATLAHEAKLVYIFHMLVPLGFLPVRRLPLVALLLPGFFFTLLTTGYWPTTSIAFQYTTHWIPYLFLATVLALGLMGSQPEGKVQRLAAVFTLVLALTSHSYNFGAVLQRESFVGGFLPVTFETKPEQVKRHQALLSLVSRIPQTASVAATEFLNPHVSTRLEAYTFRYQLPPVDYILLSKLEVTGDTSRLLASLLKKADYGLVAEAGDEFYLLRKGAPGDLTELLSRLGVRMTPRTKRHSK
jgi:uncharacterized membrane protein